MAVNIPARSWTYETDSASYLISTDKALLDLEFISSAFASEETYWCNPCSKHTIETLVANSCCFGLYATCTAPTAVAKEPQQVGMARLVTDYATFAYLLDVYVADGFKGLGLGKWLVRCANEVVDGMGELRRYMLLTGKGSRTIPFYEAFGLSATSLEDDGIVCMVKKGPGAGAFAKSH